VLDGARLANMPDSHPEYGSVIGVLVTAVEQGSRAWNSGLRANDIITAVNRRVVDSPAAVQQLLDANSGTVALNIVRDGRNQFLIMR
jgi:S1-C subfamily serine protease